MKLASSIIYRQIASLFFILLLLSALVSFFMGEKVDAIIIIITIMVINVLLGFFQEFKASKASEKLLHLVQTKIYVFRASVLSLIPVSELVVGDIVHLIAGSVAPVDIQVIESQNAFINNFEIK